MGFGLAIGALIVLVRSAGGEPQPGTVSTATTETASAGAAASHIFDPSLTAGRSVLPGLDGGPARAVAAVVAPDGTREEFVENELTLHTTDPAILQGFLDRYGGEVLRTSDPLSLDGVRASAEGDLAGWYLIDVDPGRLARVDIDSGLTQLGPGGEWRFSSESGAALVALAAGEPDLAIALNPVAELPACTVCEHPTTTGGNVDFGSQWWMVEGSELSIGVVEAWRYIRYQGFPPVTPYYPVMVAVVDSGFDLDETTGFPLYGADDYGSGRPAQLDEIDGDITAGGEAEGFANCSGDCWHGQQTFGVCCANARNLFGAAGTSGGITAGARVDTLLLRVGADTWTIAAGVYDALYNNAEVVITNVNLNCGWTCRWFDDGNFLRATVRNARVHGAVVVAPSGNARPGATGLDLDTNMTEPDGLPAGWTRPIDMYPCELEGVVCVGAIQQDRTPWDRSNWGEPVDVWAPTGILSAITRTSADPPQGDPDDFDSDELAFMGGTSASAPFTGGVVALMMTLGPAVADVEGILAATAVSLIHPRIATGYIDALAAVEAVAENQPPTLRITQPSAGASVGRDGVVLRAVVDDPEKSGPWGDEFDSTVVFTSDRQGELCRASGPYPDLGCTAAATLSLGAHRIDVIATDAFGATGSATLDIVVVDNPPTAVITFPDPGSTHPATPLNVTGFGFDPDLDVAVPDPALSWSSSIDGDLGTGASLWATLSLGSHRITLTVDSQGAVATASIDVTIVSGDGFPTVMISAPPHLTVVAPGSSVELEGTAIDPEDGVLGGAGLTWTSDIDGLLGKGLSLVVALSGPSCGSTVHRITLEAIDSDDHHGSHSISINVARLC